MTIFNCVTILLVACSSVLRTFSVYNVPNHVYTKASMASKQMKIFDYSE